MKKPKRAVEEQDDPLEEHFTGQDLEKERKQSGRKRKKRPRKSELVYRSTDRSSKETKFR